MSVELCELNKRRPEANTKMKHVEVLERQARNDDASRLSVTTTASRS